MAYFLRATGEDIVVSKRHQTWYDVCSIKADHSQTADGVPASAISLQGKANGCPAQAQTALYLPTLGVFRAHFAQLHAVHACQLIGPTERRHHSGYCC